MENNEGQDGQKLSTGSMVETSVQWQGRKCQKQQNTALWQQEFHDKMTAIKARAGQGVKMAEASSSRLSKVTNFPRLARDFPGLIIKNPSSWELPSPEQTGRVALHNSDRLLLRYDFDCVLLPGLLLFFQASFLNLSDNSASCLISFQKISFLLISMNWFFLAAAKNPEYSDYEGPYKQCCEFRLCPEIKAEWRVRTPKCSKQGIL